jgi:hypothetical protein
LVAVILVVLFLSVAVYGIQGRLASTRRSPVGETCR